MTGMESAGLRQETDTDGPTRAQADKARGNSGENGELHFGWRLEADLVKKRLLVRDVEGHEVQGLLYPLRPGLAPDSRYWLEQGGRAPPSPRIQYRVVQLLALSR